MGGGSSRNQRPTRTERPWPPGKPSLIPSSPKTDPDVISIRWDPPDYIGGIRLIGYYVEHRRTGSPHWVRATPVLVRGNTLTLSGLEPGMRYQFRVSAENPIGRSDPGPVSEAFAVSYQKTVSLAPSFIKPIKDIIGIENEKVEFFVVVEGTPTPKICWYKDGFEQFSNRRQRILVEGDKSFFIIHQAALVDEGEIKCTATNKAGHVMCKAQLVLEAGAGLRLPRQYEDGVLLGLGEALRLRVGVTGRPEPTLTWYHDGVELHSGGRVTLSRTERHGCLRIEEATRHDRGEYRLTAANKLASDSVSILVTITDRPLSPGQVQVVMTMGKSVTLSWSTPGDDGGCKIGNYIVEYYRVGWNMWLKAATCRQLTTTLGDLIEGSQYKFRVKAENPYGISDPSTETEVVFIPDPKRGLLEPPSKSETTIEESEVWSGDKKRRLENQASWEEAVPSPVSLANQVLRKVKMAPKRGWSEDSQNSPPRSPERGPSPRPGPVAPKRRGKVSKEQAIVEEPITYFEEDILPKRKHKPKKTVKNKSEELLDPRRYSTTEENIHSSSEMMIVLLPNGKESQQSADLGNEEMDESEEENKPDEYKKDFEGAPPISFSCPELSSCDPFDPSSLRNSVSSTDIMYEKTLERLNRDIEEQEAEMALKQRYGIERRRSFERKSSKKRSKNDSKNMTQAFDADVVMEMTGRISGEATPEPVRSSKDKFFQSDSSFEEFSMRIEHEEHVGGGDHDYDGDFDEMEDDYEEQSDSEMKHHFEIPRITPRRASLEEDTYHPRNMENANPSSGEVSHEVLAVIETQLIIPDPEPRKIVSQIFDYEKTIEAKDKELSPGINSNPKPILKVTESEKSEKKQKTNFISRMALKKNKDAPKPSTRSASADKSNKKKVRIEEPDREEENLLMSGNAAKIRRKGGVRQRRDSSDPAGVAIRYYSDIVKEFGSGQKPKTPLYLNYEELKAAAEKEGNPSKANDYETKPQSRKSLSDRGQRLSIHSEAGASYLDQDISDEIQESTHVPKLTSFAQPYSEFLLDCVLFCIALYFYLFKSPWLTIPVLLLMIYRQVHDAIARKIQRIKRIFKRE